MTWNNHDDVELAATGLVAMDVAIDPNQTSFEARENGFTLYHRPTGQSAFIETEQLPKKGIKGIKTAAIHSLDFLKGSPFVAKIACGGGAFNAAAAYKAQMQYQQASGEVHLFNSGAAMPELMCTCRQLGIQCHCLNRQQTPLNLIIDTDDDRIIIKSPTKPLPSQEIDRVQARSLERLSNHAKAIACISAKDASSVRTQIASCNGAYRFVQPTGSLSPEEEIRIASEADEEVINFIEWQRLAKLAAVQAPPTAETDPLAFPVAIRLLRIMHERGLAGSKAAVCTLGGRGVVAADWHKQLIYEIPLQLLNGNRSVPTQAGTGDKFLGKYMYFRRHWASNGKFRDPVAAACVRAMHQVAGLLGLWQDHYAIHVNSQPV